MIRYLFTFFISVLATSVFSQAISDDGNFNSYSTDSNSKNFIGSSVEAKSYIGIKGSPYLNDSMIDGVIYLKNSQQVLGKYRYNIYTDELECASNEKIYTVKKSENQDYIKIGDTKLLFQSYYYDKEKSKKGYFIELISGKYSLMLKKKIVYKPEEVDQPYSMPKPNRFEVGEDTYYLSFNGEIARKISSLKTLKKDYPELKSLLDTYKEGKNLKREKNIVGLINFINSNSK